MKKIRIDQFLAEKGLSMSLEKARKEIISGWVKVNGETIRDPRKIVRGEEVVVVERPGGDFVSRGGDKLFHALSRFSIDLRGLVTLDLGASTGGFTDCMLKAGAVRVYSVDVGYNQLDYSLRIDKRVVVMEKTHAADLKRDMFDDRIDFFTADLSFISILKVLPAVYKVFETIKGVILVKPQFEAESDQHQRGVVKRIEDHRDILKKVAEGINETGFHIAGITYSPIKGPAGNIEFLFFIEKIHNNNDEAFSPQDCSGEIYEVTETAHIMLK